MKILLAAAAVAVLAVPALGAQPGDWMPDKNAVSRVEASVRLPAGAKPLGDYVRYYTGIVAAKDRFPGNVPLGRKLIWAEYVLPEAKSGQPGVHIVASDGMPIIMDGGCSIVNVYYDVEASRVAFAACNGYA